MSETSASLLDRLRLQPEDQDWRRLVDLYTPLIHGWLRLHDEALAAVDALKDLAPAAGEVAQISMTSLPRVPALKSSMTVDASSRV